MSWRRAERGWQQRSHPLLPRPAAGAAGAERSVLVWEPRKWTLLDRWSNCLKYEATGLHFATGARGGSVGGVVGVLGRCGRGTCRRRLLLALHSR